MPADEGTKEASEAILHRGREPAIGAHEVSLIRKPTIAPGPPAGPEQSAAESGIVQSGILPWRTGADGGVEVLLITSRGGNRWIVPKGRLTARMSLRESACREAFEEAGVRGSADSRPLGSFVTDKTDLLGRTRKLEVVVYAMEVIEELADWPEKGERQRRWCSAAEAAAAVESDSLRALILGFSPAARGTA